MTSKERLAALTDCTACHLCREGNRGPTQWSGPEDSPLMFVGEGPGGVEDEYGVPLVGPSGKLLDKATLECRPYKRPYLRNQHRKMSSSQQPYPDPR